MRILGSTILAASLSLAAAAQSASEFEAAILGEVKSPGKSHFQRGATLKDLWLFAGGPTAKADPESVALIRDGREINVDLPALAQTPLHPGDVLIVAAGRRVSVTGEVQEPGTFALSNRSKNPIGYALAAADALRRPGQGA